MSIIVAVNKNGQIAVAADTVHLYGTRREYRDNIVGRPKVRKIGRSYIGGVGWAVYDNILNHYVRSLKRMPTLRDEPAIFDFFLKLWKNLKDRYQVVNDQPVNEEQSPFASIDSEFLVANRQGIFQVDANLTVTRFARYTAIGSGDRFAHGVLYALFDSRLSAEQLARRAAEAAVYFDQDCGGEIEVYRVC